MGRQNVGTRKGLDASGRTATPAPEISSSARADVFLQCLRATLRARDDTDLARRICHALVASDVYAEAYVRIEDQSHVPERVRSWYCGANETFVKDAERFLTEASPAHAIRAAMEAASGSVRQITSDAAAAALRCGEACAGVLFVCTGGRALAKDELRELGTLAEDISGCVSRLREDAQRHAIESSERRLRETFENAGVGIARIGMDSRFVEVNQRFCEMLGYSREELVGRRTLDVTVPEDYGPGPAFRAQAQAGRVTTLRGEKRYVHKDGRHVWVRRTMSAIYDADGQAREAISIVEDITEQKRAQEAVQAERNLLRTIIDAVPHYIYVKDDQCRFTITNAAWLDGRGLTRERVIGKTVYEIFPAGAAANMDTQDREVLSSGKPIIEAEQQIESPTPDGTQLRWTSTTKVPLRDPGGNIIGVVGVSRDITESRQNEAQRARAEETVARERMLLRSIIDALPDYIYVKDREGRFQLGNKSWLAARGIDSEQVRGKTVFEVFPPAMAQRMHEQDTQVMRSGVAVIEQEQRIVLRDDNPQSAWRWSSTTKVPMRDESGGVIGIVGFSRDITVRKRLEHEREMEHAVAQALSESRSIAETMSRLIRTICEGMGWSYGARWMYDAPAGMLRRVEWWCEFELELEEADASYWLQRTPGPGGLLRRAWAEQRATWLRDVSVLKNFSRKPTCDKLGFRSAFVFPIMAQEGPIGILEFFGREVREPDDALIQVSTALAHQIGQFIARKQAEESLQESEQQLRAMFDNAEVGIAVTALDFRFLRVNDKYCGILGYSREELLGMHAFDVNLKEYVPRMQELRQQMNIGDIPNIVDEKQLVRKDGSLVWVSLAGSVVRASDGTPRYHVAVIQDISAARRAAAALKESEEQFRILAQYDVLTELPNRSLFYDRLAHGIAQAKRHAWILGVLFIDVDRFKYVNDTFGHAAGDKLLKRVSQRLQSCVRDEDTVGRLSGDEFAIVLGSLGAAEDAAVVAKKIIAQLNQPFDLEGTELYVTASIGITLYPTDSTDRDELIRNADVAMYRAKDLGRNNYQFYTPDLNRRTREMLSLESELRRALDREEFMLYYQPKVRLADGRITGLEALVRWRHPERGLVTPADFMPLLEETGLIVQAGRWILREVCRQLQAWQTAGVPVVPIAVNLSARQFLASDLADSIAHALAEYSTPAALIQMEVTESSVMANTDDVAATLERLRSMGLEIAIDDFGTGYSSLTWLKRFPIRALKIDQSFIRDIIEDHDDDAITRAVISMAHSLQLGVVAEGVETRAQLERLAEYGCDEAQGYLFSKPLAPEECGRLLEEGGTLPRERNTGSD
jgi:diguanylate cyclase (GGDEF)-like protein/PAS domain S-box-containing protein